ncbi:MAG: UDP-N-acetylmuramate dehydrogenase [Candidatus Pacebacteria bacterium]|nr:UDP-N-acetylmuramate dehydrogenase [Candidatus Paceibacterota bacterium]MBP9780967.1 UDP-N-acetylmuramate dehydrogenase [Candidatus Paceibacterota bacterium]
MEDISLKFKKNVSLAAYSTYKIGGFADYFFIAQNQEDLKSAIIYARENNIHYFLLGAGANILFGDKGFRGLVIKNESDNVCFKDEYCIAESGATIENLISYSAEKGLSGLENFAGIPSTVGGALWQNLHFLTADRKDTFFIEMLVDSVKILDENNTECVVDRDFFEFGYDFSILHTRNIVVLEVTFKLFQSTKEKIKMQANENIAWRKERQPQLDIYPSCGSVFKKIENVGAGRLIEKVGLKGHQIGGIKVSEKHANFLVNTGEGKASDVRTLIQKIQNEVKEQTGYWLETEISFVGEF